MAKDPPDVKPFFKVEPLNEWDKTAFYFYAILTFFFVLLHFWGSNGAKQGFLIGYVIILQLSIYLLNYRSLRNFRVYCLWFGIGILQFLAYFMLKDDVAYKTPTGSVAGLLRNTIVLLVLFQGLRFLSIKFQNKELVAPAKGGGKDLFNERKVSILDSFLCVIYMTAWGSLSFFFN